MKITVASVHAADTLLDTEVFLTSQGKGFQWQFVCTTGSSNKFWSIGIHESARINKASSSTYTVVTQWGPIGSQSPQEAIPFTNSQFASCEDFVLRKIKEKVKKDYKFEKVVDPWPSLYNRGKLENVSISITIPEQVSYTAGEWDIL